MSRESCSESLASSWPKAWCLIPAGKLSVALAKKPSIEFDVFDSASAQAALAKMDKVIAAHEAELVEMLRKRELLEQLASVSSPNGTIVDAVVRLLDTRLEPMRAAEVTKALPGKPNQKTVAWALWKAEKEERIQKLRSGLYASEFYEPEKAA
jgi:hypothetical protein